MLRLQQNSPAEGKIMLKFKTIKIEIKLVTMQT
jgi:hypothetical protein